MFERAFTGLDGPAKNMINVAATGATGESSGVDYIISGKPIDDGVTTGSGSKYNPDLDKIADRIINLVICDGADAKGPVIEILRDLIGPIR